MSQLQKRDYFYLISSLPEMVLDQSRAPFTMVEFVAQLEEALEPPDFLQVRMALRPHDNNNLLLLLGEGKGKWDGLGAFSESEMQDCLKAEQGLPDYMHRFYQAYQSEQPVTPGQSWTNQLTGLYYESALAETEGFLNDWLGFEQGLRNFLTAWNIRSYELSNEGQFIGQSEAIELLKKSRARDFGLSAEYPYLNKLLSELERDDLMVREKAIDRVLWNFIDEQLVFHYFSIEVVLGYLLQLRMLQRWLSIDPQVGQERVRSFISEMEQKIELS